MWSYSGASTPHPFLVPAGLGGRLLQERRFQTIPLVGLRQSLVSVTSGFAARPRLQRPAKECTVPPPTPPAHTFRQQAANPSSSLRLTGVA